MTRRVEQDPALVGRRLMVATPAPQSHRFGLRGIEIGDREIEMNLLRCAFIRPGRRLVVRYPNGRDGQMRKPDAHELLGADSNHAAEQLGPKGREDGRIVTVDGDGSQVRYSHRAILERVSYLSKRHRTLMPR